MTTFSVAPFFTLALLSLTHFAAQGSCAVFLGKQHPRVARSIDLLHELDQALEEGGTGGDGRQRARMEARLQELEEAMLPTFRTLPRLPGDRLNSGAVRYLLYRLFLSKYNWAVRGFENGGDAWNSTSPAEIFSVAERSSGVESIFERRLATVGLTLRETAILAGTLESLVHDETTARLQAVYRLVGACAEGALDEQSAQQVLEGFMMMFMLNLDPDQVPADAFEELSLQIEAASPYWSETQAWVRQIRQEVVVTLPPEERNSPQAMLRVAEEMDHRYGQKADDECSSYRSEIRKYEHGTTGRVPLHAFYGAAVYDGHWQFVESPAYLRDLGALDETDPEQPSVIIANYMHSPSNCVGSSAFYTVCCTNHCEDLFGQVERHVGASDASPAQLLSILERLPSPTVAAPRVLPGALVERLERIAAEHGGKVPLHGRLFAQFMHNAFPLECEFPHLSGTTKPMRYLDWENETGQAAIASQDEMEELLLNCGDSCEASRSPSSSGAAADAALVWHPEEEFFVHVPEEPQYVGAGNSRKWFRACAVFAAAASVGLALLRTAATAGNLAAPSFDSLKKHEHLI